MDGDSRQRLRSSKHTDRNREIFKENFSLLMRKFHRILFYLLLKTNFPQVEVSPKKEAIQYFPSLRKVRIVYRSGKGLDSEQKVLNSNLKIP